MLKILMITTGLLTLGACAGDIKYEYPERVDKRYERPTEYKQEDRLFGADTLKFTLGGDKQPKQQAAKAAQQPAAKSLWQAALVVLSDYPLQTVDKADGLIMSEWFPSNGRMLKINAVITDSVKITVLARQKSKNPSDEVQNFDQRLADKIKNDILAHTQH
ncbi:MAG TPA: hypothetical protein DD624_08405 [Alphaproteobacteria bacterium]|nr:hypothetical protein [Alphaproteobacteria bacterium]